MPSITSTQTIENLRIVFANHGLPQKVVTDNGSSFTSEEFRTIMSHNGIMHVTTAPYHPSSNGLAERAVQTFKQGLRRTSGSFLQERLSKFLFTYRLTPQSTTGVTPSSLLMGHRIRSRLDALFPSVTSRVEKQQSKQAAYHDSQKLLQSFKVGDLVYAKDFSTMPTSWTPGKVTKVTGPLSYRVEHLDGCDFRRHVDAICNRVARYPCPQPQVDNSDDDYYLPDIPVTPTTPCTHPCYPYYSSTSFMFYIRSPSRPPPDRLGW